MQQNFNPYYRSYLEAGTEAEYLWEGLSQSIAAHEYWHNVECTRVQAVPTGLCRLVFVVLLTDGQYLVGQTGVKVLLRDTQFGQYRTRLEAFQRGDVGGSLILRTVDETGPVNV